MFNRILTAQMKDTPTGGQWGISRGYMETPHRAVRCVLQPGPRVLVCDCLFGETDAMTFKEFVAGLPELFSPVIMTNDAATRSMLHGSRVVPSVGQVDAELVVPQGIKLKDLEPWLPLLRSTSIALLNGAEDVFWV